MTERARGFQRLILADLGDNDAVVVTIAKARVQSFNSDYLSNEGRKVVLNFDEFGEKDYVVNATSYTALSERYGRGTDNQFVDWIGKPCVLIKTETTDLRNQPMTAVWVARPVDWEAAVRAVRGTAAAPRKRAPRKATKKRD